MTHVNDPDTAPRRYGTPPVHFRAGELLPALAARAERTKGTTGPALTEIAQRDLERYYALLAQSLPTFSVSEALLLVDALNGTLSPFNAPQDARLLWAAVADAVDLDQLAKKWDVNSEALIARLRKLTPFEQLAVVDAVERFWRATTTTFSGSDDEATNNQRVRDVGLVAKEAKEAK